MVIGIDGNEANVSFRVGIGEYAYELLRQFSSYTTSDVSFKIYIKSPPLADLPKESQRWTYQIVKPGRFWTQIGLPINLFLHRPRPDVFFTPSHYAPRFSPIPVVISVMDLSYIYFPELFKAKDLYQLRSWTKYSARMAKKVLTISQASKNDIIKYLGIPLQKVLITYPGIKMKSQNSKLQSNQALLKKKYGINGEYILFVGTLQPRKNITRLIEAFSRMDKRENLTLIIVGKKGWLYQDILEAPNKFGVEDDVLFLEFVSDEELILLYQKALFFILPSLYEGFGLPVLEAMSFGCPVITSNVSSLPEAGGDAALYVNPNDVMDIKEKMQMLANNKELRFQLKEKGFKQVKKFSWEETAKKTLEVLQAVARSH